jgi:DNA-binding beta-propeller fold protein YncE
MHLQAYCVAPLLDQPCTIWRTFLDRKSLLLRAGIAAVLLASLIVAAPAQDVRFEHVLDIGSEGNGPGQFQYVEDFDMAADGRHLLVTDAAHAYVQVFDKTTGAFRFRFGGKGDGDENLEKPEGISVAPDGRIFVSDYATGEVKIYSANYKWFSTFSEYGTQPGQNIKSEFGDIHAEKYYMPEAGNHRISVWDLDAKFQFAFGKPGKAEGEFNNPESVKFSPDGKMYVADLKNDRIQVFDPDGKFLFAWGSSGAGPGQFNAPAGIAIDAEGNVFVTEIGNSRVQMFDKSGRFLSQLGEKGSGKGQFNNLHGIYCDLATGWLYIADTGNNRVQVYKPVKTGS